MPIGDEDDNIMIDSPEALRRIAEMSDEQREQMPLPPRLVARKMMLPFNASLNDTGYEGLGYVRLFSAQPQCIFKPKGLMIWGAPDDADVEQIWIGKNLQVVAALGRIPAKWFSMAQSYEQIERALAEGIDPPSWPDFDVVQVAMTVQVNIISRYRLPPDIKLVMWGLGVQ